VLDELFEFGEPDSCDYEDLMDFSLVDSNGIPWPDNIFVLEEYTFKVDLGYLYTS